VKIFTEKPNNIKLENLDFHNRSNAIPRSISEKINYHFKVPHDKYKNPLTSSQEVGWFREEKLNKNHRSFPRISCEITQFADEYCFSKGRSPFVRKDFVSKGQNK